MRTSFGNWALGLSLGVCVVYAAGFLGRSSLAQTKAKGEQHRSPCDVAVVNDALVLTANSTADSVSLVDIEKGTVLAEVAVGRRPEVVVVAPNGQLAVVSNLWSGSLTVLKVHERKLEVQATIPVGAFPRGVVFTPKGDQVWVALAGEDAVVRVDLEKRQIVQRLAAEREPRSVALSRDGKWLAAACSKSSQLRLWDVAQGKQVLEKTIWDAFNFRALVFTPDEEYVLCPHQVHRDFPVTKENIDNGWVIDNRMTRLILKPEAIPSYWQISLDRRGEAVADPHGLAFNPAGNLLALSAGGTQELLLFEQKLIPWTPGDPGDFIDFSLEDGKRMRRIPLGGRPLGVAFAGDDRVVVANYLLDAVQVVDAKAGKLVKTIPLGGPKEISQARKGETLFYDAKRSHHQWFSCHTCHVDGHTTGLNFDTLNDHSYGTPKLTPTLHHVARTAPYTWLGWQKELSAAIKKSYTETMFGPEPTKEEIAAVEAYLGTLQHPPHPRATKLSEAAKRGQVVFTGKAHCSKCHRGDTFSSPSTYDVKIGFDTDLEKYFNPPSLLGVYDRGPFLHDGRAKALEDLLRRHHTPEMVGGEKITEQEEHDLLEYLRSL